MSKGSPLVSLTWRRGVQQGSFLLLLSNTSAWLTWHERTSVFCGKSTRFTSGEWATQTGTPVTAEGGSSGPANLTLALPLQEHSHHCGLLRTSCGAAGDHLPDGERARGGCFWSVTALVCRATAGRDSAVSIGHRLWEQLSNPNSALAVRPWASKHQFLHLQIGGSMKPGRGL